jgi:hypothetical protein
MEMPQSLQTIAEIGIAFAGFTGLVTAFRRTSGPLTSIHKYRLRVLLALSFGAMFLSFLPELLEGLQLPLSTLWRTAALAAALYSFVFVWWWSVATRTMMQSAPEIFQRYALARMLTGHVAIFLLLAAVVAGSLAPYRSTVYLAALIWYLAHAAQQFSRMLFIQPRDEAADAF